MSKEKEQLLQYIKEAKEELEVHKMKVKELESKIRRYEARL